MADRPSFGNPAVSFPRPYAAQDVDEATLYATAYLTAAKIAANATAPHAVERVAGLPAPHDGLNWEMAFLNFRQP